MLRVNEATHLSERQNGTEKVGSKGSIEGQCGRGVEEGKWGKMISVQKRTGHAMLLAH